MNREEMIRKIWREEYMSEPKMTLEEMIAHLDRQRALRCYDDAVPNTPCPKYEAIKAALRAGQEIEAVLKHALAKELLLDGTAKRWSARDWARHALQAWDAAVGGKE